MPPWAVDAMIASVVAIVTVISVVVDDRQDSGVSMKPWAWLLLAAELVPLVWRRRWPVAVMVTSFGAAMMYGGAHLPDPPIMFGPLLATYSAAAYGPRRLQLPIIVVLTVGGLAAITFGDQSDVADVAVGFFTGISAWIIGLTMRSQREHAAWMEARRDDDTRQAATQERIAIARDLHDIVAHHVSVIAVQAEGAQSVLESRPERAGEAMADVAETARTALAELRRLLGVLRSEGGVAPQPGLAAIDDLVDSVRHAGMDVRFTRLADSDVDAVAGLTAYRVVQEALTNVLKHAGPCATDVSVAVRDDALVVSVVDDGRGPGVVNGGHGLIGMRERVAVLGGTLDAGEGDHGGFAVRAWLPLTPA